MSSVAGPSHGAPPSAGLGPPPTPGAELKRRADGEAETPRRTKHHRPPLPPPHILATLVPDSPAFAELMKIEQKLDWTLLRKKAEINDALGRPVRVKRTLRVFVSNTAHDQAWQLALAEPAKASNEGAGGAGGEGDGADVAMGEAGAGTLDSAGATSTGSAAGAQGEGSRADLTTGKGIAGWVLRVEGRLLESGNARLDKTRRKFSTFLRTVVVEFDNREAPTFPEGNIVEADPDHQWHPQPLQPPLDGFEVLRRGDANINCRIVMHVAHHPERFRVLSPLADLLAIKEGTRTDVISAMWKYVKSVGAQDKDDGSVVRPVGGLDKVFPPNTDALPFHQLPEVVTRHLSHPEPIIIPYTIRVDQDFTLHQKCFDIPIEIEDPLKSKLSHIVSTFEGEEGKEIAKLEDKVGELAFFARDLKQKRDFLESFAVNPQVFIHNWLAAQARDLDQMLGYQIGVNGFNGGSVREEDLRRSDLFNLPWVDEAVTIHEASRMEMERRAMQAAPPRR